MFPICKSVQINEDTVRGSESRMLRDSFAIKGGGSGKDRSAKDRTAASSYRRIKLGKVEDDG